MNPLEAIQEYDEAFEKWWNEVRELSHNVMPVELDPNYEFAAGRFMDELDPFGDYDSGMTPAEFVVNLNL